MTEEKDFQTLIQERFAKLPKVVQDAILSGSPEKRLRELSQEHQLHLDQWQTLENLVMLTLIGAYHSEELEERIAREIGVQQETARALATDITKIVFEPIREELERGLEHPSAKKEEKSDVEKARDVELAAREAQSGAPAAVPAPPAPQTSSIPPGTPPKPRPLIKTERAPVSPVYKPRESSTERKSIDGDPYRESPQ